MSDIEIIGAARRVAEHCRAVADATATTSGEPGGHHVHSAAHHAVTLRIHQQTIPVPYLRDLAAAFGDVAQAMERRVAADPTLDDDRWWQLHGFLAAWHGAWGPYEYVVADNVRLDLLTQPAPAEPRYDLLADATDAQSMTGLASSCDWVVDRLGP